jgi:Tol biopolymer transport system component
MNRMTWWTLGAVLLWSAVTVGTFRLEAAELLIGETSATHPTGAGDSSAPRISADGRWLVFTSEAGDLVPNDRNAFADVFLRDRQTGETSLISRREGDGQSADGESRSPDLTPDGRYVVFQSTATDLVSSGLVPPSTNAWRSLIYRYHRTTGEMRLINIHRPAPVPNPLGLVALTNVARALVDPMISPDGQRVLFSTGR